MLTVLSDAAVETLARRAEAEAARLRREAALVGQRWPDLAAELNAEAEALHLWAAKVQFLRGYSLPALPALTHARLHTLHVGGEQ